MKLLRATSHMLALVSLIGSVSSAAFAGNCQTRLIPFPTVPAQNFIQMSCEHLVVNVGQGATAGSAIADVLGGQKRVLANKSAGGAVREVISQGLDSSGNQTCVVSDFSIGGGNPVANCPANTTHYRGILHHAE